AGRRGRCDGLPVRHVQLDAQRGVSHAAARPENANEAAAGWPPPRPVAIPAKGCVPLRQGDASRQDRRRHAELVELRHLDDARRELVGDARETRPAPLPPAGGRAGGACIPLVRHGARTHLSRRRPRVVAIAGTQGKTVVKRTVVELLARAPCRVWENPPPPTPSMGLPFATRGRHPAARPPVRLLAGLTRALWTAYGT